MFYTYLWLREDGTPYYAGKGKGNRAFTTDNHIVHVPVDFTRIILQEWLSEEDAFEAEKFLIVYYGRVDLGTGCLRNLTDGGEGVVGHRHIVETRQKLRELNLGKTPWNKGKIASEEARRHQSEAHKGQTVSEERRLEIIKNLIGRPVSKETRNKSRESNLRTWANKDLRRKVGEANKGRVPWIKGKTHTDEARQKQSEARGKWWAAKKLRESCPN